jgi:hypothetical protein
VGHGGLRRKVKPAEHACGGPGRASGFAAGHPASGAHNRQHHDAGICLGAGRATAAAAAAGPRQPPWWLPSCWPCGCRRGGYIRYRKTGNRIDSEEIDALTATHVVSSEFESRGPNASVHRTTVRERATGRLLASASGANFGGGLARPVLGVWGSAQCPNPITAQGQAVFQAQYHLARDTLCKR